MLDASPSRAAALAVDRRPDSAATIAALRQRGGDRFDPARFRFIEAVARRLPSQPEAVRKTLGDRLAKALADYGERFEQAQDQAQDTATRLGAEFPEAGDDLARLCAAGDFGGLRRRAAQLENQGKGAPLAELVRRLGQASRDDGGAGKASADAPERHQSAGAAPAELKSLQYFRATWSKLSVDRQLTQALAQGPESAGPLNSHLLVLQSLKRLRELSPDYLNRFMSYVDALLWLDQASGGPAIRKSVLSGDSDKKRKPVRPKAR